MQTQLDKPEQDIAATESVGLLSDSGTSSKQARALEASATDLLEKVTLDERPQTTRVLPSTKWPRKLLGHSLTPARENHWNLGDSTCPICFNEFNKVGKLAQFPCLHHFCLTCCKALKTNARGNSSSHERVISCPTCRSDFPWDNIKEWSNFREAERNIPLTCSDLDCLWDESSGKLIDMDNDQEKVSCPYPLRQLQDCSENDFLCTHVKFIFHWLKSRFALKGYRISCLTYMDRLGDFFDKDKIPEGSIRKNSGIFLNVQHPDGRMRELYFSSVHLKKGDCPKDWFFNLVKDYRTDILISTLMFSHPAAFNIDTSVFIKNYNFWNDTLIIQSSGTKHVLSLSSMWNPLEKIFSFSQLKNAMSLKGINYSELFNATVIRYADRELGVVYRPGTGILSADNPVLKKGAREERPVYKQIPDGEMLLDIP